MVIKCLECNHKCGLPFNLAFHYSVYHEDKISKCACGDKTSSSNSNSSSNYNSSISSNSNSNSTYNSKPNSNSNFNTKVLTRNCNKGNSVKPLTNLF